MRSWLAGVAAVVMSCAPGCDRGHATTGGAPSDGIVFVRFVGAVTDVARARISDGALRAVTTTPNRAERWPYWSEAAQRLIYQVSPRGDVAHASDLALWDPATERESMLIATPGREERWPSWSPDGSLIAYAFRGGTPRAGVAVTRLAPNAVTLVARAGAGHLFLRPSFSPDGRLLVVERHAPGPASSKLWILAAGTPPRALTSGPAWIDTKPFFTRDGEQIVYTRRPAPEGRYEIARIDVAGGEPRAVPAGETDAHSARPSPTRDEIVFVSKQANGSSDVLVADLDGGNRRTLRATPDWNELAPRWSPDGERVVVTAVRASVAGFGSMNSRALEQSRVVVLDRSGRVLLDTPGAMADWMPPWP